MAWRSGSVAVGAIDSPRNGVRLGALLVKIRTRLLGPIFADPTLAPKPRSENPSTVEAALRTVDRALDTLCSTLGLSAAAA